MAQVRPLAQKQSWAFAEQKHGGELKSTHLSLKGRSAVKIPFHRKQQCKIDFTFYSYGCPSVK